MARRLPVFLREPEARAVLAAARTDEERLVLQLGLYLGLRVSEICKLRVEDLDLGDEPTAFIGQAKGDKDRYVPIPRRLVPDLCHAISGRAAGPLLHNRRWHRYSTRTIQRWALRIARDAGLTKHVTPHKWRHTYATELLRRGADVLEIRDLLGHSSVATTQIYAHTVPERLRGAVERL